MPQVSVRTAPADGSTRSERCCLPSPGNSLQAGGRDLTHPYTVFSPPGKKGSTPLSLEVIQACVTRSLEWVGSR